MALRATKTRSRLSARERVCIAKYQGNLYILCHSRSSKTQLSIISPNPFQKLHAPQPFTYLKKSIVNSWMKIRF